MQPLLLKGITLIITIKTKKRDREKLL